VLLEIARVLTAAGTLDAPLRVKMLFFGGEEDSMLGSTRFVRRLAAGRREIIGAINIDMIGYDQEGPKDFVIFANEASSALARCIETCTGRIPQFRYETTTTDFANSDHGPFWREGFRAVSIWEGYDHNPYYHSSLDTFDKLSPSFMSRLARVLLCAILRLAPPLAATTP
jgi:Zn-dependent M28 family amino/carboxypeptidase